MTLARTMRLLALLLLLAVPASISAQGASPDDGLAVREFRLEHAEVKEVNAIVRSLLDIRKCAIDERRQSLVLRDRPEALDEAAALIRKIDGAVPTWTLSLVARSAGEAATLRTATITDGRLMVHFGPMPVTTEDNLGIGATIQRSSSSEVDLEWTSSLDMGEWTESAQALETLHDGAVVTLVKTADAARQEALAHLLGVSGQVDTLVLEITRVEAATRHRERPKR